MLLDDARGKGLQMACRWWTWPDAKRRCLWWNRKASEAPVIQIPGIRQCVYRRNEETVRQARFEMRQAFYVVSMMEMGSE